MKHFSAKTIQIPELGKAIITDLAKPEPKEGQALLRVPHGGICGSALGSCQGGGL